MKFIISILCVVSPFMMQARLLDVFASSSSQASSTLWDQIDVGFELLSTKNYDTAATVFEGVIEDCYENIEDVDSSVLVAAVIGELLAIDALGQVDSFYRELGRVLMTVGSKLLLDAPKDDNDESHPLDDIYAKTKLSRDVLEKLNAGCKEQNFRKVIQALINY